MTPRAKLLREVQWDLNRILERMGNTRPKGLPILPLLSEVYADLIKTSEKLDRYLEGGEG